MTKALADKTLLARASSHEPYGKRSVRWTELEIYRLPAGGYEVATNGRSVKAGEEDRPSETRCATALEVLEAIKGSRKLTDLAVDVLDAAAAADETFARELGDRHHVEDLDELHAGVSPLVTGLSMIELERDGDRAIRFLGKRIGHGRSQHEGSPWLEVDVYVTKTGRYATHKTSRTKQELFSASFSVADDGRGALHSLIRPETGWIEDAVIGALREAASNDSRFAASIGDLLEPARLRDLVDSVPKLPRSYRAVLEHFMTGARAIEQLDVHGDGVAVRWENETPESPRLPRGLFVWLSRRRLVRCVREDAGSQIWTISKLGEASLNAP